MWATAIWDDKEKKLYLARDKFGEKPLYYTLVKMVHYFLVLKLNRGNT